MRQVTSQQFGGGMIADPYAGSVGKFSKSRNFDILTYPKRLMPLPSMASDTASTKIGMQITASDLVVYGVGEDTTSPGNSAVYKTTGSGWTELDKSRSGDTINYECLFEYLNNPSARTIIYAGTNRFVMIDPANSASLAYEALTFTSVGQGFVHPVTGIAYIPYQTSSGTFISQNNAGTWNHTALTLPKKYKVVSQTRYGNYLAIFVTSISTAAVPGGSTDVSGIFLWNMDTTQSYQEFIPLGNMATFAGNSVEGILVAVGTIQDNDTGSLIAKGYAGGAPQVLGEVPVTRRDSATSPTFTSYPRVNFIRRDRMHFSVDLVGGGSSSPSHKGLWSIGRNRSTGSWVMYVERYGSTDGSDVSIIAAAMRLDRLFCVHTAEGTLTKGVQSSSGWAAEYASEAYWESEVNPDMPEKDKPHKKKLMEAGLVYDPLPSGGSAKLQYRVDGGAWTDIFTETTAGATATTRKRASAAQFVSGRNIEIRPVSTGNAQIVGYHYKYIVMPH